MHKTSIMALIVWILHRLIANLLEVTIEDTQECQHNHHIANRQQCILCDLLYKAEKLSVCPSGLHADISAVSAWIEMGLD